MKYHTVRTLFAFLGIMCIVAGAGWAQNDGKTYTEDQYINALNNLDGRPYDTAYDADIDMYFKNWRDSIQLEMHGALAIRTILSPGDPLNPTRPGAVLKYAKLFAHATVGPYESTQPTVLDGEQEIYYVYEGCGEIKSASTVAELRPGIGVLIPPDVEFIITNATDATLKMYLLIEPVPDGFDAQDDMVVVDEMKLPSGSGNPHWVSIHKGLFSKDNGLATLSSVLTVQFDPITMFHPHSHVEGIEEVWTTILGDGYVLYDKNLRHQPPGTAYYIAPDGETPHANLNVSESRFKLLYFSRFPGR
jgi:mannose-6-phosphate isomerase-like protein (cupin superfamily)